MKKSKKLRVAVLMGGPSREHGVSLKSGENVFLHLDSEKYDKKKVLIDQEGNWEIEPENLKKDADVAFIVLHGIYGEDGVVQDILESYKIPYTGSGATSSALGMNKFLSLRLFRENGLNAPRSFLFSKVGFQTQKTSLVDLIRHHVGFPAVLKPNNNGSSFGVNIVLNMDDALNALEEVFDFSKEAIVQPYLYGREMTCAVIDHGWPGSEFATLPTEIIPKKNAFFDYNSKYENEGAEEITPPNNLPEYLIQILRKTAISAHRSIGARGFSRTDMILGKNGEIFVLEINTIPGLTEQSLLPKAAEASGISFSKVLDKIIETSFAK